jgi:mono/diheme cytochrome c family protein
MRQGCIGKNWIEQGRIESERFHSMISLRGFSVAVSVGVALILSASSALPAENTSRRSSLSAGFRFAETSGEELFANVCQGCHMPDGGGATGAGNYPALAKDRSLEARAYAVHVVVRGQRAMPPIGSMMSDDQVVAVVNYVRTHFGNQYPDPVTAEDVRLARP